MVLLAIYTVLFIRYYIGKPTIRTDYIAKLNEPVLKTPAEDRAWPIYRKAILATGLERKTAWEYELLDVKPSDERWPELVEKLRANAAGLQLMREAAGKPAMGFIFGPKGSAVDPEMEWTFAYDATDTSLAGVLIPHLHAMSRMVALLAADTRAAVEQRDRELVMQNLTAMHQMARQCDRQILMSQSIRMHIESTAIRQVAQAMQSPELFSDNDLQQLAHRLSKISTNTPPIDLTGEQMFFADVLQRCYTDDGNGDGYLTHEGLHHLTALGYFANPIRDSDAVRTAAIVGFMFSASRKEVEREYQYILSLAQEQLLKRAADADWSQFNDRLYQISAKATEYIHYAPVAIMMPSFQFLQQTLTRLQGRRDGVLIAIALAAHRRKAGAYPAALSDLVPHLLPSIPSDPADGQPLRYRLMDGKPIVYSVGADRDDDNGQVTTNADGEPAPDLALIWRHPRPADGDWVLYPPVQ